MKKTKQQLLVEFKKANKERKLKLANKASYSTTDEYLEYLEKGKKKKKKEIIINNIHILDCSSSMSGAKFNSALKGIKEELEVLKSQKGVTYYQSVIGFSYPTSIDKVNLTNIQDFKLQNLQAFGNTALMDAIGYTLSTLKEVVGKNSKTIVKIFTDGEENASIKYTYSKVESLIKECENLGFTITFIGTKYDVKLMEDMLHLREGNTLVHNNTAEDISRSYKSMAVNTVSYSTKVANNESVLDGFFKEEGKL